MEFIVGDVYFLSHGKGKDTKYYFSVLKAIDQPPYDLLFENGLCVTRNNLFSGEIQVLKHVASLEEYMKNLDYDAFLRRIYHDLKQVFVDFYLAENEGCCCSNMISRELSNSLNTHCDFETEHEFVGFDLILFKDEIVVNFLPKRDIYERLFYFDSKRVCGYIGDIADNNEYSDFINNKMWDLSARIDDVISKLVDGGYWK